MYLYGILVPKIITYKVVFTILHVHLFAEKKFNSNFCLLNTNRYIYKYVGTYIRVLKGSSTKVMINVCVILYIKKKKLLILIL